jgi:hypothetical protein
MGAVQALGDAFGWRLRALKVQTKTPDGREAAPLGRVSGLKPRASPRDLFQSSFIKQCRRDDIRSVKQLPAPNGNEATAPVAAAWHRYQRVVNRRCQELG